MANAKLNNETLIIDDMISEIDSYIEDQQYSVTLGNRMSTVQETLRSRVLREVVADSELKRCWFASSKRAGQDGVGVTYPDISKAGNLCKIPDKEYKKLITAQVAALGGLAVKDLLDETVTPGGTSVTLTGDMAKWFIKEYLSPKEDRGPLLDTDRPDISVSEEKGSTVRLLKQDKIRALQKAAIDGDPVAAQLVGLGVKSPSVKVEVKDGKKKA